MSDEDEVNDINDVLDNSKDDDVKNANEDNDVLSDDVETLINELFKDTEKQGDESPNSGDEEPANSPSKKEAEKAKERVKKSRLYRKIENIPQDFLDFLVQRDKAWRKKAPVWGEIIYSIYSDPEATSNAVAGPLNVSPVTVRWVAGRYVDAWKKYKDEYFAQAKSAVVEGHGAEEPAPHGTTTVTTTAGPPSRGGKKSRRYSYSTGAADDEKIPTTIYTLSSKTTTFKEVDKTLAELFGSQFHDTAIRQQVYARLGELLIFSLLQLGVVERDKIVAYSEQLSTDPSKLYEYVRNQLDAVLRLTDAQTLQRVWMELTALRSKIRALEATVDILGDTVKQYETATRFLLSLLDKKQLENFAAFVFMQEYMKQFMPQMEVGGERL